MAQPAAPDTRPATRPVTRGIVACLLLAAIGGALIVPIYARSLPKLGAFPFFYWFQLAWVPVVAIACWLCYLLLRTKPAAEDGGGRDQAGPAHAAPGQAGRGQAGREQAGPGR